MAFKVSFSLEAETDFELILIILLWNLAISQLSILKGLF